MTVNERSNGGRPDFTTTIFCRENQMCDSAAGAVERGHCQDETGYRNARSAELDGWLAAQLLIGMLRSGSLF